METNTAIITIEALSNLDLKKQKDQALAVFLNGGIDILKQELQAQFDAFVPDVNTLAGREAIKSHSFKFSKDKTLVNGIGLALIEEENDIVNRVHASCRDWREFCDEKRKAARQPLTEYEAVAKAEKDRLAKIAQEEQDRKEREYAATVANLANSRLQTLLLILGDEYNAESFGDCPLGTMREEMFQTMVTDARVTAETERQAKETAKIEAERVAQEEKDRLAEVARLDLLHKSRVDILIARGFSNRVFPKKEILTAMPEDEFQTLLAQYQNMADEAQAAQAKAERARKDEYARQEAAKAKTLLGQGRKQMLLTANSFTEDQLADMSDSEFSILRDEDREKFAADMNAKAKANAEVERLEQVWQTRIGLLNKLRSEIEVDRESLTAMSESDWQALYSTEKKKIEDAEAEKARVGVIATTRLKLLQDAGSSSEISLTDLSKLDDSQWATFFNMEVKAIADVKAAEEKRVQDAKAKEEEHVSQVNTAAVEALQKATSFYPVPERQQSRLGSGNGYRKW
jgi:hypothetical protein